MFLAVLFGLTLSAVMFNYFRRKRVRLRKSEFYTFKTFRPLLYLVGIIFIPLLFMQFWGDRFNQTAENYVKTGEKFELGEIILDGLEKKLLSDSLNLDTHFEYVKTLADYPFVKYKQFNFNRLMRLSLSEVPNERHLGLVMLALQDYFYYERINYHKTLDRVSDTSFKYLNYAYGLLYAQEYDFQKAIAFFNNEIASDGYQKGAVEELEAIFASQGLDENLDALAYHPYLWKYLRRSTKMELYWQDGAWYHYIRELVYRHLATFDWLAFIAVGMGIFVWLSFMRNLDVFEKESWWKLCFTLSVGVLFVLGVYPLNECFSTYFPLTKHSSVWEAFNYYVFTVGLVEEIVKCIPWLLVLFFTKWIDEPYDYLLYASISALGFSLSENLIYVGQRDFNIIFIRSTYCAVGHMFWSSIVAYGVLIFNRHKGNNWRYLYIPIGGLIVGAAGHGIYDFLIYIGAARLNLVFFFASLFAFTVMINNTLGASNYFDKRIKLNREQLMFRLIIGLTLVFMLQYLFVGVEYGQTISNIMLEGNLGFSLIVANFLIVIFISIEIEKGRWISLSDFSFLGMGLTKLDEYFSFVLQSARQIDASTNFTGERFRYFVVGANPFVGNVFPVVGKVLSQVEVDGKSCFFVELNKDLTVSNCLSNQAIVIPASKHLSMKDDKIEVIFWLIPSHLEHRSEFLSSELRIVGKVYSRPIGIMD